MKYCPALLVLALSACHSSAIPLGQVELLDAPATGDVKTLVQAEQSHAVRDGKHLLVYVGATWCEPCVKLHEAAAAHQLDTELGDIRFLVFDLDRDDARLTAAGYTSEFVPLIALPNPDGTASGKQASGVNKSMDTITQLVPEIRALVPLTK